MGMGAGPFRRVQGGRGGGRSAELGFGEAAAACAGAGDALDFVNADLHGSEEYRRAMVAVMARRAVEAAAARG